MLNSLDRQLSDLVARVVAHLGDRPLTFDGDFYSQGLDSIDHIKIIMEVEEAFGLRVPAADYDRLNSIAAISVFLGEQGARPPLTP